MEGKGICLRATQDIEIGTDLCAGIPPVAAAVLDSMLSSRCSACFLSLQPNSHPCVAFCKGSVSYCSQKCSDLDLFWHIQSGECRLLGLLANTQTVPRSFPALGGTCDIRAALRLLLHHEKLGLVSENSPYSNRIGLLMTNRELLLSAHGEDAEEEAEFAQQIREGAILMQLARSHNGSSGCAFMEESVLCQVVTNGVQVAVDEIIEAKGEGPLGRRLEMQCMVLGTAVYGPWFSGCNHSCSPNASYRFVLRKQDGHLDSDVQKEHSARCLMELDMNDDGIVFQSTEPLILYGPKAFLRAITKVKKNEQIFIAYTDILQPKKERQRELWLKYRFVCRCERCYNSPKQYVDELLELNHGRSFDNKGMFTYKRTEDESVLYDKLVNQLQCSIEDYFSDTNHLLFCKRLEHLLEEFLVSNNKSGMAEDASPERVFRIHPLHWMCLDAYTSLMSAYRILARENPCLHFASNLFSGLQGIAQQHPSSSRSRLYSENSREVIISPFNKEATAYALILAGAVHHYFLSGENGFIIMVARLWINVGELLWNWVVECEHSSSKQSIRAEGTQSLLQFIQMHILNHTKCDCFFLHKGHTNTSTLYHSRNANSNNDKQQSVCEDSSEVMLRASESFHYCMNRFVSVIWPVLRFGKPFLEMVQNPVDYSWLGDCQSLVLFRNCLPPSYKQNSFHKENYFNSVNPEEIDFSLCPLSEISESIAAVTKDGAYLSCNVCSTKLVAIQCMLHCLLYSKYLLEISLGFDHPLVDYIQLLL